MKIGCLVAGMALAAGLSWGSFAQDSSEPQVLGRVQADFLIEISGVVASRQNPGVLWVHNDSGGDNAIYALDLHGRLLGIYRLAGSRNRDWEDIAIGPGTDSLSWVVYVGDIGDNSRTRATKIIYRVPEPHVDTTQVTVDTTLYDVDRIVFAYPDGVHNAETLMVDPKTADIYVANKSSITTLYRVPRDAQFSPTPTLRVDTLEVVAHLLFGTAVAGDIDVESREMLIKNYSRVFGWSRGDTQTWAEALSVRYHFWPYRKEPQGEAICWTADGKGYLTISEGVHPKIYYYRPALTGLRFSGQRTPSAAVLRATWLSGREKLEATIRLPAFGPWEVRILNVRGREIVSRTVEAGMWGEHRVQFSTAGWSSGVYLVQLKLRGKIFKTQRVVVVR